MSHQTLKKVVRGKNLDVYEGYFKGYFGMVVRGTVEGRLATEL